MNKKLIGSAITIILFVLFFMFGCGNPMVDNGSGGAGDIPSAPITITFVLDMDAGNDVTLSTSHSAPASITVAAGAPVRLNQGTGFTATGPGSLTYHASGWSTESYSAQFVKIFNSSGPAPAGAGYYLPGFEAIFTEDTTL